MKTIEEVAEQVEERKDELLELLFKLIAFETPAPPARNTAAAQAFIADYLETLGAEVDQWELYPGDELVVGVFPGTRPEANCSLILNGHVDVADVRHDEPWQENPFTAFIQGDAITGRGAADMKGGLAGILFAMTLLKEAQVELPGDIILQSVTGEEVGEAGTKQCCEKGYTADFALVADTSNLHIQGQGGVITGWITVKSKETHHDAMRSSMIHAGGGLLAASAIDKMMKLLAGLQDLERHWAVTKQYEGCRPGTNTINPAVIEGGRHAAFVADECRVWITVHFYPDETHEQVIREIESYLLKVAAADPWLAENPPLFEWGGRSMIEERGEIFPALEVDPDHPAVQQLQTVHATSLHVQPVVDVSPSVTDGGWFGYAGIPAVIYGPGQFHEAHAVNETLSFKQLIDFVQVMIRFIYSWSNTEK